jgi:hypothetical protein
MRDRVLREPVVLALIVVAGALLAWRHTRSAREWLVMTDELQHLKTSLAFGDSWNPLPHLRGERTESLSVLYPLLISPVLHLFSMPLGYQLVHLENALLMSSTAIPVYLLARPLAASRLPAYVAAGLTAAVPWTALSAVVMTEAAAYPAFGWALLAMHRAVAEPSPRRDLLALAGIGLAFFARTQFVVLGVALLATIALHELMRALTSETAQPARARAAAAWQRLRGHWLLGVLVAVGVVLLVMPGEPLGAVLGSYEGTAFEGDVLPPGIWEAAERHTALVVAGVGVLPLAIALGWSLATLVRPVDEASRAYAALALVVGPALAITVASFGLRHAGGPLDRYLFYLAPVLAVGLVACLAQRRARPVGLALGALATWWLFRHTTQHFIEAPGPYISSQASAFHRVFDGRSQQLGSWVGFDDLSPTDLFAWGTLLAVVAVIALLRLAPRAALAAVCIPLGLFAVAQTDYVAREMVASQNRADGTVNAVPVDDRDWVDEAVPGDGDVAISPSPVADEYTTQRVWWNTEYWNKRINRAVVMEGYGDNTPFPGTYMSFDPTTGEVETTEPEQPPYMVFARGQTQFRPQGRVLGTYRTSLEVDAGLEVLELERPYRPGWTTDGFSPDGWLMPGEPARVQVYPREDGRAQRVTVSFDLPIHGVGTGLFELRGDGDSDRGEVASRATSEVSVEVCARGPEPLEAVVRTDSRFPLPDGRKVGVHLAHVAVNPLPRTC